VTTASLWKEKKNFCSDLAINDMKDYLGIYFW